MITRQTTRNNKQLINEPLVSFYDSDEDVHIMENSFKLPILDKETIKEWLEKVFSKIRKDQLASYVSLRIWMEKLGKSEIEWENEKNPIFNVANIYDHAHADYHRSKATRLKDEKATRLHEAMVNSLSIQDLKNVKNSKLANIAVKMDCLLTFEHMISYAEETYGSNSFNVLQGRLSNFATSAFPLPTSTDEVIQLRKIDSLCDEYRELNYSNVTDDAYKQLVMATMLQKLELTDMELRTQIKLKLSESAIDKSKPTYDELYTAIKKGYTIFTIMHGDRCVEPTAVANKVDINRKDDQRRKESKPPKLIGIAKGNCPLPNHGNHNIGDCNTLKNIMKFMQAQLLFLQANAKPTEKKPYVKKRFANIAEVTMDDLEAMESSQVLAYVSQVKNLMPEDELLPALTTFDSDDEDGDDIANAYAIEYASSDDEKA